MKKRLSVVVLLLVLVLLLCGCASKAAKVDELIDAINVVTVDSEDLIVAAENAYNELTDAEKEKVTKYQKLVEARENYEYRVEQAQKAAEKARQEAEEKRQATDLAGRIITKMAKIFKNPLNTKVNNVWYSHSNPGTIDTWYFTFELSVTNSFGIATTEYYGITLYESDTATDISNLDATLSQEVSFYLLLGGGVKWQKDSIIAMQYGKPLDATAVQNYFLKNYR